MGPFLTTQTDETKRNLSRNVIESRAKKNTTKRMQILTIVAFHKRASEGCRKPPQKVGLDCGNKSQNKVVLFGRFSPVRNGP